MKRNLTSIAVIVIAIMALKLVAVSGQSVVSTSAETITPPTGSEILANILAEKNQTPVNLYPPEYLEWLQALGNNPIPIAKSGRPVRPMSISPESLGTGSMIMAASRPSPAQPIPPSNYTVTDIGDLGGDYSEATCINGSGQVVGWSYIPGSAVHAFLWTAGVIHDLGTFGGNSTYSYATAINAAGQIVGLSDTNGVNHAFLYQNGHMQDLNSILGSVSSQAYGINASGQIVGQMTMSGGVQHGFLLTGTTVQDLGTLPGGSLSSAQAIDDFGDIAGYSTGTGFPGYHAFLYEDGTMQDLGTLGSDTSEANAINVYGEVVGQAEAVGAFRAFLYTSSMQNLGCLSGFDTSYATALNANDQVVGACALSSVQHAFLWDGTSMEDLNNQIIPLGSWLLGVANGINDAGQVVGTGSRSGHTHAFLLNPLPVGWKDAITASPSQPIFGMYPSKGSGKDSLILATHGWNPPWADLAWLDTMTNSIKTYLTGHGLVNWQVNSYKWVDGASTGITPSAAQKALEVGKQEGLALGNYLGAQGWANIHLIGHSAGAGVIQAAMERIKVLSPSTVVHCTFLDPFVGFDFAGITTYGDGADWAENYFTRDDLTQIGGFFTEGPYTQSLLTHAYNVDVTPLDPNKIVGAKFRSSATGLMEPCVKTLTHHSWPYDFYNNTITGTVTTDYAGFGFPLSQEGGNWTYALSHYAVGNTTAQVLGTPDPTCTSDIQITPPSHLNTMPDFTQLPTIESTTGTIQKYIDHLNLLTGSPVWLAAVITATNPVNTVSLDAQFTSGTGAQGLLTVLWDADTIGTIDERVVGSELKHYQFRFPNATANSTHVLGLRLDPFTNIQSTIVLTNAVINQVGVSQPFSLALTSSTTNGLSVYELTGEAGFEYTIQASTNLVNWEDIAILANTNGAVRFYDQNTTNYPMRFYRGVTPY